MGSASGVGKSTVCQGILAQLLADGYVPDQLAYFKPVTQCTDKQAVTQFCERNDIPHQEISTLIFKKGFSKAFIDGLSKTTETLLADLVTTITRVGKEKALVIIDGIGDPSTGSVVGVSNADIALALDATVIFVGIPGIGAAIDNTVLCLSYLQTKGINDIGLIYNKIPFAHRSEITRYVGRRLQQLVPNATLLGFITENAALQRDLNNEHYSAFEQWFGISIDSMLLKHFIAEN